jgi:FMN phosphatase YigB (HAD superfamily)
MDFGGAESIDQPAQRLALEIGRARRHELGVVPSRCLFVAGSAYDLSGTHKLGLPTYWHDRVGMTPPPDAPTPIEHRRSLYPLLRSIVSRG